MKLPAGLVSAASVWPFVVLWLSENIMFLPSNRIPFRPLVLNQYYEIQISPLLPENREAEEKSKSPAPSPVWYDQEAFPCSGDWPLPKKKRNIYITMNWFSNSAFHLKPEKLNGDICKMFIVLLLKSGHLHLLRTIASHIRRRWLGITLSQLSSGI